MMHLQPTDFHVEQPAVAAVTRWFCVATGPQQEMTVVRDLMKIGVKAFAPEAVRTIPRTGPRKAHERRSPLFRGYAFVQLGVPLALHDWKAVLAVESVSRLLGTGAGPSALPQGFIEALIDAGPVRDMAALGPTRFRKGHRARITSGPFANFIGMVARAESDKRIHILLRLLRGGDVSVVVPVSVLEAVEDAPLRKARA